MNAMSAMQMNVVFSLSHTVNHNVPCLAIGLTVDFDYFGLKQDKIEINK